MDEPTHAPLVSVVVPTCNRAETAARCLEALARQTHRSYEVIVVDDCSADDTPAQLRRIADEHPDLQLTLLRNEQQRGANPSRNRGVRASSGEIICFIDDDAMARPDWLEHLAAAFDDPGTSGAVGLVEDPEPRTIFDLTFRGNQRIAVRPGPALRLAGTNMAFRREVLERFTLDEDRAAAPQRADGTPDLTVSGRGDEEGLFVMMRAAGMHVEAVPGAVVLHEDFYSGRSFFRQAWKGGTAAARFVYKFKLPPRLDVSPFVLAYVTLPLGLIDWRLLGVALFFFAAALSAIIYNDLCRKGKTVWQTLITFPILLAYYHVRVLGYVTQTLRLWLGMERIDRIDLRDIARAKP
jgi:GT2 family glycosyltransferase